MDTQVLAAIIAGIVSLIVATISFIANRFATKEEQVKFERKLQRGLTEKLYDLRLEHYPKAFEITDNLRGKNIYKEKIGADYFNKILQELNNWNKTKAGFLLSDSSIQAFYRLRDALESLANTSSIVNKEKLEKVRHAKNGFRHCLREDVNLLYSEENKS